MVQVIKRLFTEEKGQGLTEYALLLGIIAAAFAVIFGLGLDKVISGKFTDIKNSLTGTSTSTATTP